MANLTLGESESGRVIDLHGFADTLSRDVPSLLHIAWSLEESHPEWRALAREAADLYAGELFRVRAVPESHLTARRFNLPVDEVSLANTASIMILFGLSHFLQSCGFDIENPTAFGEITVKLAPFRNTVALLGFEMARRISPADHRRSRLILWQRSFGLGLAIGVLVTDAHQSNPTTAAPFLPTLD